MNEYFDLTERLLACDVDRLRIAIGDIVQFLQPDTTAIEYLRELVRLIDG